MGIFGGHLWPYTNLHGINLDYILEKVGSVEQEISEAHTLLTQATETAAMIAEQMTEVRGLVDTATEDVADAHETLLQANALLDEINIKLDSLRYEKGCNWNRSESGDPQIINIPMRFGQLKSDTDLSPVETPQTNTLVSWGWFNVDTTPPAENVNAVGWYSTDKALIFPVGVIDYYDISQFKFYYTVDNTAYYELTPTIRRIDYLNGSYWTVIFPDTARYWTAVGINTTSITDKNNLPFLTGRWIHKALYYNSGVTFTNIINIADFAARAEKHSYYPQTWRLDSLDTDGTRVLKISGMYGKGRISISRYNNTVSFAGKVEIENCEPAVFFSANDATAPFFVHDDSGDYTDLITIVHSDVYLYGVAVLDVAESKVNVLAMNTANVFIRDNDVKGVNAIFRPSANTFNRITINAGSQFTGNAAYFIHPNSGYMDMQVFAGGSSPTLPEVTYGQSNVISTAQANTIFLLSDGASVTFTASRQT